MPNNVKAFFDSHNTRFEALTFDDVLLKPGHSDIAPDMVDTSSRLTRTLRCRVPLLSAAMDTVTEAPMAIALAKAGACGVIHRLLDPKPQAKEVERVKHATHKLIRTPISKPAAMTVGELLQWEAAREKSGKTVFHTHPIVDGRGRFIGIVGGKDVRYCPDRSMTLGQIMKPVASMVKAGKNTSPEQAFKIMLKKRVSALPILGRKRTDFSMYLLSDLERLFSDDRGGYNLDDDGRLIAAAAISSHPKELSRSHLLIDAGVDIIVVDTAHGDSDATALQVQRVKRQSGKVQVIAGNVATYDGAKLLADAGADAIKVGIGPGSICTTRIVAGVGVPQLTAINDAVRGVDGYDVPVIADGGVRSTGDMIKAFCAGAETVMAGSIFAGTDESPGMLTIEKGREVKTYRGMGSAAVMQISGERYRQNKDNFVAEGVEGTVPYRGPVSRVVGKCVNGIRTGCGYLGVRAIRELPYAANFVRISNNGLRESHPHDVILDGISSFVS
jgi:IMP dehydrogenase